MKDLKTKTGLGREVGYVKSGNTYTAIEGQPGAAGIDFTVTTPIDGYIHTHYTGTFPIFSGTDVLAIYQLQQNGQISNLATFTAGVVTADGTTYLMMVENTTQFATFAQENLSTDANFKSFENYYKNNQITNQLLLGLDRKASFELAFLTAIEGSGLKLFKGDAANFNSWQAIKVVDKATVADNCN